MSVLASLRDRSEARRKAAVEGARTPGDVRFYRLMAIERLDISDSEL